LSSFTNQFNLVQLGLGLSSYSLYTAQSARRHNVNSHRPLLYRSVEIMWCGGLRPALGSGRYSVPLRLGSVKPDTSSFSFLANCDRAYTWWDNIERISFQSYVYTKILSYLYTLPH